MSTYGTREPIHKTDRLPDRESRPVVAKGEGRGGGNDWQSGLSRCKLLYTGWINCNILLHSTGNHVQHHVITIMGKKMKK